MCKSGDVRIFGISEVSVDWKKSPRIGHGGFASVYYGNLKDHQRTPVAIKRLLGETRPDYFICIYNVK